MGIAIPQLAPASEDRASGAQVIDGSLKFKRNSSSVGSYLSRTPSSSGSRTTFTMSAWIKRSSNISEWQRIFAASPGGADISGLAFRGDGNTDGLRLQNQTASWNSHWTSTGKFRDCNGWYHIVMSVDLNLGSGESQKIYINGVRDVGSYNPGAEPTSSQPYYFNNSGTEHRIGSSQSYPTPFDGYMSQFYWIDGLALGPENFGYTDPLTNTWRPKKYTGTFPSGDPASSIFTSNTLLTWAGGTAESNWTLSNSNKTATFSASNTYSDVWTAVLSNTATYAFRLTSSGVDGNGGWLFTDSTGVSGSHPDERGSNTLGQRSNETTLGAHGTFASQNGVSSGQGVMSGFGDSQPQAGSVIDFVVNMSARKVWVKAASSASWVGGGNPTNSSSTASFELPSGTIYFGFVQYDGTSTIEFGDDSTDNNSFYLPMDGNSPIGEDKSGRGNNWTPVNFGGSNTIEKATGALPILNTDGGGNVARIGVRTDSNHSNLVLAVPLVGSATDVSNSINSGTTTKTITVSGDPTASSTQGNFYGGSYYFDGNGDYLEVDTPVLGSGDWTIEEWFKQQPGTTMQNYWDVSLGVNGDSNSENGA